MLRAFIFFLQLLDPLHQPFDPFTGKIIAPLGQLGLDLGYIPVMHRGLLTCPISKILIAPGTCGSLPHHGFAALRTIYLHAGDTAFMGRFGPTSRTDAGI
jgi:hypothetical protein